MKKIMIPESLEDCYKFLCGSIDEAISYLKARKEDGWERIDLDWDSDFGDIYVTFLRDRLETDKEYNKRMKELAKLKETNKKIKAEKIKSEMELYEKLKKKYEKV